MANTKIKMYLCGMPLEQKRESSIDQVLRISGVEPSDSPQTNLERHLYMDDFSQFESEILHLKHAVSRFTQNLLHAQPVYEESDDNNPAMPGQPAASLSDIKENPVAMTSKDYALLPDVILVHIFSYLELKDICCMSRVCKHWHDVAKDPRLWKIVQQSPAGVDDLDGFLNSYIGQSLIFFRPYCMNNNGLQHIQQKCSNIQALWLVDVKLVDLDLTLLPTSLVSLAMVPLVPPLSHEGELTCYPSGDWWKMFNPKTFPKLDFLYLDRIDIPSSTQLLNLLYLLLELVTLTGLRFENCPFKIKREFIELIATKLHNLTFLSFAGCVDLPDSLISDVCRNQKLTHLRLNRVWTLNPVMDLSPLASLKDLKILHMESKYTAPHVATFSSDVCDTIEMFKHLDMLVISGVDAYEAMLSYKVVEVMNDKIRRQVSFERDLSWRHWTNKAFLIRIVF